MKNEEIIVEKLDKILKILSIQVAPDASITERARILKMAGLENKEISEVLNISIESVRTLTSNLRKDKKKKGK